MTDMSVKERTNHNRRLTEVHSRKPNPDKRIIAVAYMVENLAQIVPEARQLLAWRRAQATGEPGSPNDVNVSGGDPTSTVEGALLARTQAEADLDDINDTIADIAVMVSDATKMVRRIIGRPEPQPDVHCHGGRGSEWLKLGSLVWGDETCSDKVHARGLCGKHYVAARRYCLAKGLEWADRTPTE